MSQSATTQAPLVVGIVGGIGSGKSEVSHVLAEMTGATIISGDEAGHEALRDSEIRNRVVERWGNAIVNEDGEINRKRLGQIVFADAAERKALEAIVFPWIKARLAQRLEQAKAQASSSLIVLDAAVQLEAGWSDVCDRLIFIDVPREIRLKRIAAQRGWTKKEVELREAAQWSLEDKRKHCDHVLDNSGSSEDLTRQLTQLLRLWHVASPPDEGKTPTTVDSSLSRTDPSP